MIFADPRLRSDSSLELDADAERRRELDDLPLPAPGKVPRSRLYRDSAGTASGRPDLGRFLAAASRSAGQPLPAHLLAKLEAALRADLRAVRLHTGPESQRAAAALAANAFTYGTDVHFASGKFDPDSVAGQRLIAHEVAHTVQQGPTTPSSGAVEVSSPRDRDEVAAHAFAEKFVSSELDPARQEAAAGEVAAVSSMWTPRRQPRMDAGLAESRGAVASHSAADGTIHRDPKAGAGGQINPEQELEVAIPGGKLKLKGDGAAVEIPFDEQKYPKEDFEKSHRFEPLQFCPGVYGYISVGCSAGITDSGMIGVSGTKSGPKDSPLWALTVSGTNKVKGEAKAWLGVGIAVGAPGIANLSAEATLIPTAELVAEAGVTGALTYNKSAGVGGHFDFPIKVEASLFVELALRLLYEVFWKEHPTEFAKYTVGKWDIAWAGFDFKPRWTIGQGWSANVVQPQITWGSKPNPTHVGGREASAQVAEYKRRKAEYDMNSQGTGGGPSSHPDDGRPDADGGEVLVDDGSGVDTLQPGSVPDAGGGASGGGYSGGGNACSSEDPADNCESTEEPVCRDAADRSAVAEDARQRLAAAAATAGDRLPNGLRERLEASLGADLGGVRVHTGSASEQASRALRANAFATGQEIHFAPGKYDPGSEAGQKLIAHEVAHTVQQGGTRPRVQNQLEVSQPGDASEREADRFAEGFVTGHDGGGIGSLASGVIARDVVHRDVEGSAPAAGNDAAAAGSDAEPQGTGGKKKPTVTVEIPATKKGAAITFDAADYKQLYQQVMARADGGEPAGTHSAELLGEDTQFDEESGDVVTATFKIQLTTALPEWPNKSKQPPEHQQKFAAWLASVVEHENRHEAAYRREFDQLRTQVVGPKVSDVSSQYDTVAAAADKAQNVVDQNQPAALAIPGGTEKVGREAADGGTVDGNAAQAVDAAASSVGHGLPSRLRQRLEDSLGADLGTVRVHTGSASEQASRALRANAYATGQDIHFAPGKYDPSSEAGQMLIAHEVAHTVQQGVSPLPTQADQTISSPGDSNEREAESFAQDFGHGGSPLVGHGAVGVIARTPSDSPDSTPAKGDANAELVAKQPQVQRIKTSAAGRYGQLAGTHQATIKMADVADGSMQAFASAYAEAWQRMKNVLAAAKQTAEDQTVYADIAASLAIAAVAQLVVDPPVKALMVVKGVGRVATLALEAGADGVGELAEMAAGWAVGATGVTGPDAGAVGGPVGDSPEKKAAANHKAIKDILHKANDVTRGLSVLHKLALRASEVSGEIQAHSTGGKGNLPVDEVLQDVEALDRAEQASVGVEGPTSALQSSVQAVSTQAVADAGRFPPTEIEMDLWSRWIATHDNSLLDIDDIEQHLESLGLLSKGGRDSELDVDFGDNTTFLDTQEAKEQAILRDQIRPLIGQTVTLSFGTFGWIGDGKQRGSGPVLSGKGGCWIPLVGGTRLEHAIEGPRDWRLEGPAVRVDSWTKKGRNINVTLVSSGRAIRPEPNMSMPDGGEEGSPPAHDAEASPPVGPETRPTTGVKATEQEKAQLIAKQPAVNRVKDSADGRHAQLIGAHRQAVETTTSADASMETFVAAYTEAWQRMTNVLAAAKQTAETQAIYADIAVGLAIAVLGPIAAAPLANVEAVAAVLKLASTLAGQAGVAMVHEAGEIAAGKGVDLLGLKGPDAAAVDGPVGDSPDKKAAANHKAIKDTLRKAGAVVGGLEVLHRLAMRASELNSEIQAYSTGGEGTLPVLRVLSQVDALGKAYDASSGIEGPIAAVQRSAAALAAQAAADAGRFPAVEIEKDLWTRWIATHDNSLLDIDDIEQHLESMGLLSRGGRDSELDVDFGDNTTFLDTQEAKEQAILRDQIQPLIGQTVKLSFGTFGWVDNGKQQGSEPVLSGKGGPWIPLVGGARLEHAIEGPRDWELEGPMVRVDSWTKKGRNINVTMVSAGRAVPRGDKPAEGETPDTVNNTPWSAT